MRYTLPFLFLGLLLSCVPYEAPKEDLGSCYATVTVENDWLWPIAVFNDRTNERLIWDLNPMNEETICLGYNDVVEGLSLRIRVKGWVGEYRYVEPLYDIRTGGDWTLQIHSFQRFAYSWGVR